MLTDVQAIVLAAGKATRFNTGKTKLIEKICGQEIILYPLAVLDELSLPITLVIGFQGNTIKHIVERQYPHRIQYVEQCEQNGTAGAARLTRNKWHANTILIMKADIPLISASTLEQLHKKHTESNAVISFIATHNGDPSGFSYTRVINDTDKIYLRERAELTLDEVQKHCCINAGIYLISRDFLTANIDHIERNPHTNEFHFSDLVNRATELGKTVSMTLAPFDQIRGINTHEELWAAEQIKRAELIRYWMERGVRFFAAQSVHMDLDVEIGQGSFIGCSVHLLNGTRIGNNTIISPFSIIENSTLGDSVTVHPHSIIRQSTIGDHTLIGPFAHLQENTIVGENSAIGNFVETKNTTIGNQTKAKHLSYLGNAEIGSGVNIGAGTITCNYDGKTKHSTRIEDNVFIGTNNSLVAPITIAKDSFTAAGSVISENVPSNALAIARARQINKEGYAQKLREKMNKEVKSNTKKPLSFIGAVKSSNDSPTTDQ